MSDIRIERAGLHQEAASRIRRLIIRGSMAPGERLGEAALSEALGISRTPLREALKQLASEGLVELRPNRGARVAPLDPQEITDLFEALAGIERTAAELGAVRATSQEQRRLADLQERMEHHHSQGDVHSYFDVNQQAHALVVRMAHNSVLESTHRLLAGRVERVRYLALGVLGRWDESVVEHRHILEAIQNREPERAGQLLARHVRRTGEVMSNLQSTDIAVTNSATSGVVDVEQADGKRIIA